MLVCKYYWILAKTALQITQHTGPESIILLVAFDIFGQLLLISLNLRPMSILNFNEDEVFQSLQWTNMWGVPGISEFLILNSKTQAQHNLIVVDKRLSGNPIVTNRLKKFELFAMLDHPCLYKIQIIHRTFSRDEILSLDTLKISPVDRPETGLHQMGRRA
ncbi:hypothetical protein Fcan01_24512 [Folsomia candida]|uniref:Uncharacterized protein n=1 Tax=Folsomia candida TaxID=158441 RepID=A0A226D7L1_FOLCA|nr:hypothetical protein Fcan01_24512 [Folsomia candida]